MILLKRRGFTLIELLVVVAIIAIIASLLIVSINASRAKSRDARRIADLASIQLALETYRDSQGYYPVTRDHPIGSTWIYSDNSPRVNNTGFSNEDCTAAANTCLTDWSYLQTSLVSYLQVLPKDPIDGRVYSTHADPAFYNKYLYTYMATKTGYKLMTHLEQNNTEMTSDYGEYTDLYEIFSSNANTWPRTAMCGATCP